MNLVTCYPSRTARHAADLQTLLGLAPNNNPSTRTREEAEKFTLQIDLPGVRKEDVKLTVENDELRVEAVRHLGTEEQPQTATYQRVFFLSEEVDTEKISAEQKDGVLSLTLPKKEQAKPKSISINVG